MILLQRNQRGYRKVNERTMITVWIGMVIVCATVLILFGHAYINAEVVYTGTISMVITPIVFYISNLNNRPPSGGSMP